MMSKILKSINFKIINNYKTIRCLNKINKINKHNNPHVSLIIFSKDRPFQLRSLLFAIKENLFGLSNIFVVYRASSNAMLKRYIKIENMFKPEGMKFIEEKNDFKKDLNLTLQLVKTSHIMFSVDDILIFDKVNISDLKSIIEKNHIFSLRLGKNITYCYPMNKNQIIPMNFKRHKGDIISWKINDGEYDFSYPFSLDMHVLSTELIQLVSKQLLYNSVNSYEGALNIITKYISNWDIYSFNNSKCVNLPFNKIQNENDNNFAGFDHKELNVDFDNNKIYDYRYIKNKKIYSPHQILQIPKVKIKI